MTYSQAMDRNRDLIKRTTGTWRFYTDSSLSLDNVGHTDDSDIPLAHCLTDQQAVHSSESSDVCKARLHLRDKTTAVFVKKFHFRSQRDRIMHLLRKGRAIRAVEADTMLIRQGFTAPQTLIAGWRQQYGIRRDFFTVTTALEGYTTLYVQVDRVAREGRSAKRAFLAGLAHTVAQLHATNISHGDMRAGNILARHDREWQFAFLDNERTKRHITLPMRARIKNLVQLSLLINPAISRTDRLYFYQVYCEQCFGSFNKQLLTKVLHKTHKRISRLVEKKRIEQSDLWI